MGKCTMGTKTNYLNVDYDHGVLYGEEPLMNANDHVSGKHVIHFGNCTSQKNPGNNGMKLTNLFPIEDVD